MAAGISTCRRLCYHYNMNVKIPEAVKALSRALGGELYAVGGIVRNGLLGVPLSDLDVATPLTPDRVTELCKAAGIAVIQKAPDFGTVECVAEGEHMECTTFRQDVYFENGSHRPKSVAFSKDLQTDARRRDFTVNAIYARPETGEVIDPVGGLLDLEQKVIRAAQQDPEITMADDGLRVLRLVRFACELGFSIEPATFEAAKNHAAGLCDLPAERILPELNKILLSDARYGATQPDGEQAAYRGLRLLNQLGALEYVLPEVCEGKGVAQKAQYHAYDVFEHCLHAVAAAPPTLELRWAALLHDVAKPYCLRTFGKMRGHDKEGQRISKQVLLRLRAPEKLAERVSQLVAWHMYDLDGTAKDSTLRKQIQAFGPAFTLQLCALREADFVGSGMGATAETTAGRWRRLLEKMQQEGVPFDPKDMAITGKDLIELGYFGKEVGQVKEALFAHLANHPKDNDGRRLRALAPRFYKK